MECPKIPKKHFEVHNRVDPYCHKKIAKQYWFYLAFENNICNDYITGYSFSEPLIFASINTEYDIRLFIELQVQYEKTTISVHVVYVYRPSCVQQIVLNVTETI